MGYYMRVREAGNLKGRVAFLPVTDHPTEEVFLTREIVLTIPLDGDPAAAEAKFRTWLSQPPVQPVPIAYNDSPLEKGEESGTEGTTNRQFSLATA